ncbi:MAG: COG1361 S-layer family protein [Candidatus Methanofastidiosia archaeon]
MGTNKVWIRKFGIIFIFLIIMSSKPFFAKAEETVILTISVRDEFDNPIENAKCSLDKKFPDEDEKEIKDQFTKDGVCEFVIERSHTYILFVKKAGFITHSEEIDVKRLDVDIEVILEYTSETPSVYIKGFRVDPEEIAPGDSFELSIILQNQGTGDALSLILEFSGIEGSQGLGKFSPLYPSSVIFLERLDVRESLVQKAKFRIDGNADSGIYNLIVKLEYKDRNGVTYTNTSSVGITVLRVIHLKVINLNYKESVTPEEKFTFSADIVNTGRFNANGVTVELQAPLEFELERESFYVGTLESDDFETFETEITVSKGATSTEHIAKLLITYVDDFNREHFIEKEVRITIEKKEETTGEGEKKEESLWDKIIKFIKALLGLD